MYVGTDLICAKNPISAHTGVSSLAGGLSLSMSIYLLLYFVYVIKGSVESAHMRRPNRAFVACQCNTYRERSGSVVECLTRVRRAAGLSLIGVTALRSLSKTHLS